ncbi:MAG: serine/threonine protein kinase [Elusimicrobia bacterium]|nr:serine/threonine protein kinase [Elusimicrobiota bacterium]
MSGLLLLWLALAPGPVLAASAGQNFVESLEAARDDISRQMEELSPLVQELEALKARHMEKNDPSGQAAARKRLRSAIKPRMKALKELLQAFGELRYAEERRVIITALAGRVEKRDVPRDFGPALTRRYVWHNFHYEARSFMRKVDDVLDEEESAFKAAQNALRKRRIWMRASLSLLIVLLLVIGVIGRRLLPWFAGGSKALTEGAVWNNNYRIERALGGAASEAGGLAADAAFAAVFEATDLALQRRVVLKRLREALIRDRGGIERFLAEARRAAALKHPNIAEVYAAFEEAGQAFLVFEFVAGRTLSRRLEISQRLSLGSAKDAVKQIAAALDHAHARSVLHRSLRPSSVIVSEGGAVKVMDFGAVPGSARASSPYSAPEQEHSGVALRESDIFSLGATLYELLTGRPPYKRGRLDSKLKMLYAPASKLIAGLPPAVDDVLSKALRPDPRERFHSGAEFAAALDAIAAS